MNYIYKITCLPNRRMYIGQHCWSGEGWDPRYFGSSGNPDFDTDLELYPDTDKDWSKEILEIVDSDDQDLLDARETYWIGQWYDGGKVCYNLNPKGRGWHLTKEQLSSNGKKAAETNKKNGTSACYGGTHEDHVESGRKAGKKGGAACKERHLGICGLTFDERSENGKIYGKLGGEKSKELGVGVHGRSPEKMSEDGRKQV